MYTVNRSYGSVCAMFVRVVTLTVSSAAICFYVCCCFTDELSAQHPKQSINQSTFYILGDDQYTPLVMSLCSVFYINSTCCQLSYAATGVLPMDTLFIFSNSKVLRTENPKSSFTKLRNFRL